MGALKNAIKRLPGVLLLQHALRRLKLRYQHRRLKTPEELFTHYYRSNSWGSDESVSGQGSTLKYTEKLRAELPRIIERHGIRTILDAPCGDYNWMRSVPRENGVRYIGGDIVEDLVAANQRLFADRQTEFKKIDVTTDPLPAADLWMCRDCLFHFSNADIFRSLANFIRSDIRYLLTSTHPNSPANYDIFTGDFRLLNLEKPPFNFPKAELYVDDWIEGFPVRQLALWSREVVSDSMAGNKTCKSVLKRAT